MAHYTLPEAAEHALYSAERALALLELLTAAQGEAQIEAKGEELSALLAIIRQPLRQALEAARFAAD